MNNLYIFLFFEYIYYFVGKLTPTIPINKENQKNALFS